MKHIKLIIPVVTAEVIMETVEGVSYGNYNGLDVTATANYLGKSQVYAKRALDASVQLGFLEIRNSRYFVINDAIDASRASKEQRPIIFRKFLQKFDPFILFITLIDRGDTKTNAARKIKVIYGLETSIDNIIFPLINWGEYAKVITKKKDQIIIQTDTGQKLTTEYVMELSSAVQSDMKARMYITNKFGDEVFGYMKDEEIDFLCRALREYSNNPRGSIEDTGRTFEDFLRRIANDKGVSVNNCTGIQQLADSLKGHNLIEVKHLELCKGINSLRIAAAHSKDRNTGKPWTLKEDTAIVFILLSLTVIRSIYNFIFKQLQIF